MGTDMHMMVEISQDGASWRPLMDSPQAIKCPRNYAMFAALADVRNGSTRHEPVWMEPHMHTIEGREVEIPGHWYDIEDGGHERIEPIDVPRGIPDDASPAWRANVLIWESRSNMVETTWLLPQEVLAADWDQQVIRSSLVTEEDYITLTETGKTPQRQIGQFAGDGVLEVTEEEYAEGKRGENMTLIRATWTEGPLRAMVSGLLDMLRGLEEQKDDSTKVRLMLLFES